MIAQVRCAAQGQMSHPEPVENFVGWKTVIRRRWLRPAGCGPRCGWAAGQPGAALGRGGTGVGQPPKVLGNEAALVESVAGELEGLLNSGKS